MRRTSLLTTARYLHTQDEETCRTSWARVTPYPTAFSELLPNHHVYMVFADNLRRDLRQSLYALLRRARWK